VSLARTIPRPLLGGKFNAPMLRNSNFFMTLESMKILRILTDVWLPDFKFGEDASEDAVVLGDGDAQYCFARPVAG
jgi:uncharacterized Fe-S radical SAM superfamily protein PflX